MEIKELADKIIDKGLQLNASDIYILPYKLKYYEIIYRIQNRQLKLYQLSINECNKLILFLKYFSEMDVGEKRKIQLGSCLYIVNHKKIRLRLSTVSNYLKQESLVIRLLYNNQQKTMKYKSNLSFSVLQSILKSKGLHLFAGPVGSGKTTLMYKMAKNIASDKQIITIEDPIEVEEASFLQLQVQPKINLTYNNLIRLCLRHRPDILIIGEIRDEDTAKSAIRAALTGHVIFATIHANSVDGIYDRLRDLKVSEIDIKQTVQSMTYQQILELKCNSCRGKCNLFCPNHYKNYCVFCETQSCNLKNLKGWNDVLWKAFQIGAITKEVFEEETQIKNS